jgi:hypothetical protein
MPTFPEALIRLYAARIGSRVTPRDTQQHWTRATREILAAFASDCQWQSVCTGVRNHEFLLDFMAVEPATEKAKLAVESEWGPLGSVIHDFRKLLYIKCDQKVMICGSGGGRLCSRLEEIASRYPCHTAGETYVVLEVSESELCIRSYIWTATADGPAQVRFQPFLETVPFAFVAAFAS